MQLKYSGEAEYDQVRNINLRASHLQSIQHLDKVSYADDGSASDYNYQCVWFY